MFTVEVRDAQGRLVPITRNNVTFQINRLRACLIGVGNGDPTDHDSDKGSSRKAFGRPMHGHHPVHQVRRFYFC